MYQKPRGTKDLYGKEMVLTQYIENTVINVLENYGFSRIDLPTFESTELYIRGVGNDTDVVSKEMYTFLDKSDRSMTLRPEGTAGLVRAYIENRMDIELSVPVKFYYRLPMFRYEKVQKGRQREFTQIGVETIGTKEALADYELIEICLKILEKLNISENVKLKINSLGNKEVREKYKGELKKYLKLREEKYCSDCRRRIDTNILRVLDCKNESCKQMNVDAPKLVDMLDGEDKEHFEELKQYLNASPYKDIYEIDPLIVRGLDYYNRTVFEIVDETTKAILGGGRYDDLVEELDGPKTPAVGFALGVERIREILLNKLTDEEIYALDNNIEYMVICGKNIANNIYANKILNILREKNIKCVTDIYGRSFKAQFKYANKLNVSKVIIISEEDIAKNTMQVKDMRNGEQKEMTIEELKNI